MHINLKKALPSLLQQVPQPQKPKTGGLQVPGPVSDPNGNCWLPPVLQESTHAYRRMPADLFVKGAGDTKAIDANDVRQGGIGDCWLMSAMISSARVKPEALEKLIKPLGKGKYAVTLYPRDDKTGIKSAKSVIVDDRFPSRADKSAAYAKPGDAGKSGKGELWPMLLEKAAASVLGNRYDNLQGGNALRGMDLLTSNPAKGREVKMVAWKIDPYGRQVKENLPTGKLAADLANRLKAGQPLALFNASSQGCDGQQLLTGHWYAVTDVDVKKQTVTLQDPNGVTSGTFKLSAVQDAFSSLNAGAPL